MVCHLENYGSIRTSFLKAERQGKYQLGCGFASSAACRGARPDCRVDAHSNDHPINLMRFKNHHAVTLMGLVLQSMHVSARHEPAQIVECNRPNA